MLKKDGSKNSQDETWVQKGRVIVLMKSLVKAKEIG